MKPARLAVPGRSAASASGRPTSRAARARPDAAWVLALCLACASRAALASEPLGERELAAELAGNTLTGYNGSLVFSEYHSPDGRIFGHNGGAAADGACWHVRGSAVCYYYPEEARGTRGGAAEFCWRLERAGSAGYRISLIGRNSGGVARLETGNPFGHSDHGKSWTCDALISRGPDPACRREVGEEPSCRASVSHHR